MNVFFFFWFKTVHLSLTLATAMALCQPDIHDTHAYSVFTSYESDSNDHHSRDFLFVRLNLIFNLQSFVTDLSFCDKKKKYMFYIRFIFALFDLLNENRVTRTTALTYYITTWNMDWWLVRSCRNFSVKNPTSKNRIPSWWPNWPIKRAQDV